MSQGSSPDNVSEIEQARATAKAKLAADKAKAEKETAKPDDKRTDPQLTKDISNTLTAVFEVIRFAARFFGKRDIPKLTAEEAAHGAISWLPLARKFAIIATLTIWIGAPIWLITTLGNKWQEGKPIEPPKKPAPPTVKEKADK
jgi:hypothetical protein